MVVVVDYGMGNLRSVENAALFLGKKLNISGSAATVVKAEKIILPGVGHFARAVRELNQRKIFNVLQERIAAGVPFLGICLGLQLLLEESQEAPGVKGLGIIQGRVKRFPATQAVPHMGWNQVKFKNKGERIKEKGKKREEGLSSGVKKGSFFYFAHSYYCCPKEQSDVLAVTDYGKVKFASALHRKNVWGVQFHPEKSQAEGLKLFGNFLSNKIKRSL